MQEIKAAVCHTFGDPLSVETVLLRSPNAGEVEVTIDACAICHSDITALDGGWGGDLPAVYGHEAAGRVSAVGPTVDGYSVGDPVIVTLIRSCGRCVNCGSGRSVHCEVPYDRNQGPLSAVGGGLMQHGLNCGAFAEKVVVDQSQIAKIPNAMPLASASLLSCGVITGFGAAVNTARIRPGQTVVVIGAGGVGLSAVQGARVAGAVRIVAVDMVPEKLDAALEFGATDGILASTEKPWRSLFKIAPRGADAVLVTVGAISAYDTATRYLNRGGAVYAVGMPHSGQMMELAPDIHAATGQSIVGSLMGDTVLQRDIPWYCDLYAQGRLKLDELISGRWPLEEINEAIADTRTGSARRNVIVF